MKRLTSTLLPRPTTQRAPRATAFLAVAALMGAACGGSDGGSGEGSAAEADVPAATATGEEMCAAVDLDAVAALFDDEDAPTDRWGASADPLAIPNTCFVALGTPAAKAFELQFRQENLGGVEGFAAVVADLERSHLITPLSGTGDEAVTFENTITAGSAFRVGDAVYVAMGPSRFVGLVSSIEIGKLLAAGL